MTYCSMTHTGRCYTSYCPERHVVLPELTLDNQNSHLRTRNPLDSQMSPRLNYSIQRYGLVCVVTVIMTALDILLLRVCM